MPTTSALERVWLVEQVVLAVVALAAVAAPLVGWVLQTFRILCHELGHALVGWVFGRPAIPAFDLSHGGGVTLIRDRWSLLALLVGVCWVWLIRVVWPCRPLAMAAAAAALVWGLILLADADEPLIHLMGHGGTVVFAAVFLARGMTGDGTAHVIDRWLSSLVAWSLVWIEIGFAWGVLHDLADRERYHAGKGGIENDFIRLADAWRCQLDTLLWLHLLAVIPVALGGALAWWWWRGRPHPTWPKA